MRKFLFTNPELVGLMVTALLLWEVLSPLHAGNMCLLVLPLQEPTCKAEAKEKCLVSWVSFLGSSTVL